MSESPKKDRAFEALDFVINVLREHEKNLDRLISDLKEVVKSIGKGEEFSDRIKRIEERLSSIQTEISALTKFISTLRKPAATIRPFGPFIAVKCKRWDEFKVLAMGADTVSFLLKEAGKIFRADALKEGHVLTYVGKIPQDVTMLKTWLSRELGIPEEKVFEGALAES